jgi:ribose/xylose/arabinose/galactoside ABC-type transport system permease subunit
MTTLAVAVGGTLLSGGQGGVASTAVGVLPLGVIFNLFNLEGTIMGAERAARCLPSRHGSGAEPAAAAGGA